MPTLAPPARAAAVDAAPGATLRVSCRTLGGTKALVSFSGNAEDVTFTLPEPAAVFPDRAIYSPQGQADPSETGSTMPKCAAARS